MGCHRNFWAIVKYIFEIHGSIFKPNKIWKSHLPFQQYMNKEPRFQISAKSDNVWRKYITFSGSRSWIYLEVVVHYTAAPRCFVGDNFLTWNCWHAYISIYKLWFISCFNELMWFLTIKATIETPHCCHLAAKFWTWVNVMRFHGQKVFIANVDLNKFALL